MNIQLVEDRIEPALAFGPEAAEAAGLLRSLANEKRLLILCHLAAAGELPVGALADRVGLSQSALSQHLARLRGEGLVATRREMQSIHYRIDDSRALQMLELLHRLYCPQLGTPGDDNAR